MMTPTIIKNARAELETQEKQKTLKLDRKLKNRSNSRDHTDRKVAGIKGAGEKSI
jgi:hypothetical protein